MSCWMPRDMRLKDSASSPSWSRERIRIWCAKSPCRSFCVPTERAWTPRVIDRARTRPRTRATAYIDDEDEAQDAEGVEQESGTLRPLASRGSWIGRQPPHEGPRLVLEGERHPVEGAPLAGLPVRLLRQGHEQEAGAGRAVTRWPPSSIRDAACPGSHAASRPGLVRRAPTSISLRWRTWMPVRRSRSA